ncbi:stress-induced protein [Pseudomonas capeferrum]|uniref:KGG domain-containing protein n=1 Tax=Pseudomonas capeferrum TaxID=1495066 RepID=UPI0015E2DA6E|nr:KGG domain-containing protein [Pseudomonas capeferrum]MBA1204125.1 stress-induced protein [Pseudomonas capeferrum]
MANNQGKSGKEGGQKNSGNFANDREKASEAGKKGGQSSSGRGSHQESGQKGGRS